MSNIANVGNQAAINPLTNFAADPGAPSLSPEMLLAYCSSRLDSIDKNIQQYFDEQQKRNRGMKDSSSLVSMLNQWPEAWGSEKLNSLEPGKKAWHMEDHAKKGNELLALYRSSDSPEVKQRCAEAFEKITGMKVSEFADPNSKVTAGQVGEAAAAGKIVGADATAWTAQIDAIKSDQSSMSKSAEMNMIQLQSLVSQRQLAVQLTTQLMQTLHESAKQTVGNIRA